MSLCVQTNFKKLASKIQTMLKYSPFLLILFLLSCQNAPNPVIQPEIITAQTRQSEPFEERKFSLMERELEYLMEIWPGEYDNPEQLDFDKYANKKGIENGGHLRIHSFFQRLDLPEFGEYVIYEESYKNENPNEIYRQVIYQLSPDNEAKAMMAKLYHLKTPKPILAAKQKLNFEKDLSPTSPLLENGCQLKLQREGMAFIGKTIAKDCLKDEDSKTQTIDYQLRISENEFWFREQKYNSITNTLLADNQQLSWYNLEKVRCFVCMIDFPREEGGRPVKTEHYIKIHDQGGKFEFDYSDGRHMVLGMRNTWSFGMQRETFVIFIQADNQDGKTLIYSWGNPGADRIGFNPGWIRVQCDLDTPKNNKLQLQLRPDS